MRVYAAAEHLPFYAAKSTGANFTVATENLNEKRKKYGKRVK